MKKTLIPLVIFLLSFSLNAQQWVVQTSGVTTSLNAVSVVTGNLAWVGGDGGVVLRTTDGGTTWVNVSNGKVPATQHINSIYAIDVNTAIVACNPDNGAPEAYRTTDGGNTWTMVLTQVGGFFDAVAFSNATNGYLVGDPVGGRWAFFKTTDAGATWDSTGLNIPQADAEAGWTNSMFVENSTIAFGTNKSRIYLSTDGGGSFMQVPTPGVTNSWSINIFEDGGVISGNGTALIRTTDKGATFTSLNPTGGTTTIYSAVVKGKIVYHTRATRIMGTKDDGVKWDTVFTSTAGNVNLLGLARNGDDVVYAVTVGGAIVKGASLGLPVQLTAFNAVPMSNGVYLSWLTSTEINNKGFEIERSSANGVFKSVGFVNGAGTTSERQKYSFTDPVTSGKYTYRLKQVDFDGTYSYSKLIEVDLNGSLSYELEQNYPNPFNPSTRINFTVKEAGLVSLKVYNVLGDEVATLVNEVRDAGNHEVVFNASSLSSGVYFYTIKTANFTSTKKMLLTK